MEDQVLQYGALGVLAFALYLWNRDTRDTRKVLTKVIQDNTEAMTELRKEIRDLPRSCPIRGRHDGDS